MASKIIVILGPTASGKSDLAVKIARRFNGEIISADSRQIYKGLDIGSGKVPRDKISKSKIRNPKYFYKGIRHHLLDVASPKKTFTVSQYQKLAQKALKDIIKRGKIPIICGGTGLYIDTLIYGYQFPEVPPNPKLRVKLEKLSTEKLFTKLQKLDPRRSQNIDRFNRRRLIRALEIVLTTKKPVPILNKISVNQLKDQYKSASILKIGVKTSLEKLKLRIKKRLLARLRQGMIKEVENLRKPFGSAQGVSWKRLDDLGLEYRYLSRFLRQRARINADLTQTNTEKKQIIQKLKNEMIGILEKEIYRYSKRQMTWFKRDATIHWIENLNEAIKLTREFLAK